jgi:hypothetical protein
LLLDYDTDQHWFVLDIDLQQPIGQFPANRANDIGVFFGYRRNREDTARFYPSFALQLKDNPDEDNQSRLLVGTVFFDEVQDGHRNFNRFFNPFPGDAGEIMLPPIDRLKPRWRHITVRAVDDQVTVTAGNARPLLLDWRRIWADSPNHEEGSIDPRGGVGIWMNAGEGYFADATLTPLPSEH